jgi:myo-inositol-1(or 4)-monophosphatase
MPDAPALDLGAARQAAEQAARAARDVLDHYARDRARLTLHDKGTFELASEADVEAQRTLVATLDGVVPGASFLGEEDPDASAAPAPDDASLRWILDPLDGTTNFLHGVPPWAVSVGLARGHTPLVGVVLDVPHAELFSAAQGQGLTRNGEPARVRATDDLSGALVATGFPYRKFDYAPAYLDVLGAFFGRCRGVRRHGAASVDLAWVACGRFEAFWETGLSPWDVAAGLCLVQEGGGQTTDFGGAPNPVFGGQVLATNGALHDAVRGLLAPLRDVRG